MVSLIAVAVAALILCLANKDNIVFYLRGWDLGLQSSDISALKKLAKLNKLQNPKNLFYSYELLDNSIKRLINVSDASPRRKNVRYQKLIGKLFEYRTKVENERKEEAGITSTANLQVGQDLTLVFKDAPVTYSATVLGTGNTLIITYPEPVKRSMDMSLPETMSGVPVEAQFFVRYDATYSVKTTIINQGVYHDGRVLILKKSDNVERTQKRESPRAECSFSGEFFVRAMAKSDAGVPCLVENISTTGALVSLPIRGGEKNMSIRLKLRIGNLPVVMDGRIKYVRFDEASNKTFVHIEGAPIENAMKNTINAYVYDVIPAAY